MTRAQCARVVGCLFRTKVVTIGIALVVLMGGELGTAHAQKIVPKTVKLAREQPVPYEPDYEEWRDCGLRKGDVNAFVSHRSSRAQRKTKQATITVNYGPNFPQEARDAYERAVSIWESHIESDIEIRIDADRISEPSPGTLGGTIPKQFWVLTPEEGEEGESFIAGDALADVLVGEDLAPDSVDMETDFNFDRDDWYFGTGNAPSGKIDFTTVALHEIAHGLHYLSLCNYDEGKCNYDVSETGEPEKLVAGIYSEFLHERRENGRLTAITDQSEYSTSESIQSALTSDRLVFDGGGANTLASGSTGPVPPKIYAPFTYERGSSISHLDENTYSFEGVNALMTPQVAPAETNRQPGPIVCGQFFDMGWPMGEGCFSEFPGVFALQKAGRDTSQNQITLDWRVKDTAQVKKYVIEKEYFRGPTEQIVRDTTEAPPVTIGPLGLGKFAFRLRWIRSDGSEQESLGQVTKTVRLQNEQVKVVSTDEQGRATVKASWTVPAGSRSFRHVLERRRGTTGEFSVVSRANRPSFEIPRQSPGKYEYRVRSVDQEGNVVLSPTESLEVELQGDLFIAGPYPNPAQEQAIVELTAKKTQEISVEVYNTIGERVYRADRQLKQKIPVRLTLDSRRWGSGVYFLRVTGEEFRKTRKMVVVR